MTFMTISSDSAPIGAVPSIGVRGGGSGTGRFSKPGPTSNSSTEYSVPGWISSAGTNQRNMPS